jgi:hypothetical protein
MSNTVLHRMHSAARGATPRGFVENILLRTHVLCVRTDQVVAHPELFKSIVIKLKGLPFEKSLHGKSMARLPRIWNTFIRCINVPGDIVEFGVFEGVVSLMFALAIKELGIDKRVHLFDSWQGLPESSEVDAPCFEKGQYRAPIDALRQRILLLDVGRQIVMHPGLFEDTLSELDPQVSELRFSFAHLDADLYASTKVCLEFCKPRMSPGAYLRFDEIHHSGPRLASEEVLGWAQEFVRF